jgi:hypothetical protein
VEAQNIFLTLIYYAIIAISVNVKRQTMETKNAFVVEMKNTRREF